MRVIKAVSVVDNRLVSTFAKGEWQKEYAEGVETKPDVGYLFAFPRRAIREAKSAMGTSDIVQYWLADAEVVGRMLSWDVYMNVSRWLTFWGKFELRLRVRGADYLLCSSITLIKRLA